MRRGDGRHVDARCAVEQHVAVEHDAAAVGREQPGDHVDHVVLPAPEAPNSAVAPPAASKRGVDREIAQPLFDVDRQHRQAPCSRAAGAAREPFRRDQRGERDDDGDHHQLQRGGVAARHLRERVDRRRDGLRLARDVGDEGDGGAELAERLGKASTMPAMMPGSASGSVTVTKAPEPAGAERRGGVLQPAVDRLDRQPDRAAPSAETPSRRRRAPRRSSGTRTRCRNDRPGMRRPAPCART